MSKVWKWWRWWQWSRQRLWWHRQQRIGYLQRSQRTKMLISTHCQQRLSCCVLFTPPQASTLPPTHAATKPRLKRVIRFIFGNEDMQTLPTPYIWSNQHLGEGRSATLTPPHLPSGLYTSTSARRSCAAKIWIQHEFKLRFVLNATSSTL